MKKNNLIPFSAVLLGLATFGILTLLIIFSHNLAVTISVLFLFVLLYLLLFVWQKKQYEKTIYIFNVSGVFIRSDDLLL